MATFDTFSYLKKRQKPTFVLPFIPLCLKICLELKMWLRLKIWLGLNMWLCLKKCLHLKIWLNLKIWLRLKILLRLNKWLHLKIIFNHLETYFNYHFQITSFKNWRHSFHSRFSKLSLRILVERRFWLLGIFIIHIMWRGVHVINSPSAKIVNFRCWNEYLCGGY